MERRVEGRDRRMFPGLAWPRGGSDNGQITIEMMTETKAWPLAVWREQPARLGQGRLERKRRKQKQLQCLR